MQRYPPLAMINGWAFTLHDRWSRLQIPGSCRKEMRASTCKTTKRDVVERVTGDMHSLTGRSETPCQCFAHQHDLHTMRTGPFSTHALDAKSSSFTTYKLAVSPPSCFPPSWLHYTLALSYLSLLRRAGTRACFTRRDGSREANVSLRVCRAEKEG